MKEKFLIMFAIAVAVMIGYYFEFHTDLKSSSDNSVVHSELMR